MKKSIISLAFIACLAGACQRAPEHAAGKWSEAVAIHFDPALKPFYHGVASGDPLPDRVILWTRVTPEDSLASIAVKWEVAEDANFTSVYKSDTLSTSASRDYTVKVDVDALTPDKVYYYRFSALGATSITGRTKTAPVNVKDSIKFAVVSCANWEWGYFNAYDKIADRPVLDAVLHLGDYIYEYGTGRYGDTTIGRINIPSHEVISLQDYRTRYSLYHLDKGLRRVHQQHPFIGIWDDHEIANNSYTGGAQNHQPNEGDYSIRKAAAKKVYYEWIPIRESDQHYRSFSFGPLADLIMLDERLAGRTQQADSLGDPRYGSEQQSMLGPDQLHWLEDNLMRSRASWKIIGNQVIFSPMDLSVFNYTNLDNWNGYPLERKKIMDFIRAGKLNDLVILTGDTHASWAIEVTPEPIKSNSPIAVEFGTPSISSSNSDERLGVPKTKEIEQSLISANHHLKFVNERDHGYLLLTLYSEKARSEWYFVNTLRQPESDEYLARRFEVFKGSVKLK